MLPGKPKFIYFLLIVLMLTEVGIQICIYKKKEKKKERGTNSLKIEQCNNFQWF
jgi:hypothetical protein